MVKGGYFKNFNIQKIDFEADFSFFFKNFLFLLVLIHFEKFVGGPEFWPTWPTLQFRYRLFL